MEQIEKNRLNDAFLFWYCYPLILRLFLNSMLVFFEKFCYIKNSGNFGSCVFLLRTKIQRDCDFAHGQTKK